jgi:hypothetical protein
MERAYLIDYLTDNVVNNDENEKTRPFFKFAKLTNQPKDFNIFECTQVSLFLHLH